jgi:hypothetical protein
LRIPYLTAKKNRDDIMAAEMGEMTQVIPILDKPPVMKLVVSVVGGAQMTALAP